MSAPDVIRVLVADDQALVRSGFALLIDTAPYFEVVGEAEDGAAAVDLARTTMPDVVLMDIRMPEMDGIEATRRLGADPATASIRVLVLTTFDLDEYVFDALRAGASGFLLKDTAPVDLLAAIRIVAGGEALLSPRITSRLIAEFATRPLGVVPTPGVPSDGPAPHAEGLALLTDREREVLGLIARGHSNAEIAETLFVSTATAKTHVSRVLTKLHARDRAQLVVVAYESGLISPGQG